MTRATRKPHLYIAHPLTSYGTAHERACLDAIADAFREWQVIDPATRYASTGEWLAGWPKLLPTLNGLVLFADERGTVGAGCLREIADALVLGVPIGYYTPCFGVTELAGFDLLPAAMRSAAACAWPVPGEQVDAQAWTSPVAACR